MIVLEPTHRLICRYLSRLKVKSPHADSHLPGHDQFRRVEGNMHRSPRQSASCEAIGNIDSSYGERDPAGVRQKRA